MSSNPPVTIAELFNAQTKLEQLQLKAYRSSQKHWLQRLPSLLYRACRFHVEVTEFAQETDSVDHKSSSYIKYRNSPEFALFDQHLRSFVHTFCTHSCTSLENLVGDGTQNAYQTLHNTLKTAKALMGFQRPASEYSTSSSNDRYLQAFCATTPLKVPSCVSTSAPTAVEQLLKRAENLETQLETCQQELSSIRQLLAYLSR